MSLCDLRVLVTQPQLFDEAAYEAVLAAVLQLAMRAWCCIRRGLLLSDEYRSNERRIAGLLRNEMTKLERMRQPRLPPLKMKAEVGTFSKECLEVPDGAIDIEVIVSLTDDPDIRCECKRISASVEDERTKLCRLYVTDGVLRFVRDHYGRGQRVGVMIGFVVDGKWPDAAALVKEYLTKSTEHEATRPWAPERRFGRHRHLFSSRHIGKRVSREIDVLHLFLPFPRRQKRTAS